MEQISVFSLGVALLALVGLWIFVRNFRLPSDFNQKEDLRRELKIALLENRLAQKGADEKEDESQDT
ncbi:MAG: hypothetical protein ACOCW1_01495 [Chitinispirillaceae bacterium]